jgi:hypothetical protein
MIYSEIYPKTFIEKKNWLQQNYYVHKKNLIII